MTGFGYNNMVWMWPWMAAGMLLVLAVIAGIVVLTVMLVRGGDVRGSATNGGSARRILDERLARGDIDEDEYRRRRDALQ
jgi:putative membrane protein